MKLKIVTKTIASVCLVVITLFSCGCTNKFETIEPPLNSFPTVNDYVTADVVLDTLIIEKYFTGNYKYDGLYTTDSALKDNGFYEGEKGYVIYELKNTTIKVEATLVKTGADSRAAFYAKHESVNNSSIRYNYAGKFVVVVYQQENCVLVPKKAVTLLDNDGNAVVYIVDANKILKEKQIKVGYSNDSHYQVLEGITPGEKVVLK